MRFWPIRYWFRSAYLYCNYGYVMAARGLEEKTGRTWEELLRTRILEPVGRPQLIAYVGHHHSTKKLHKLSFSKITSSVQFLHRNNYFNLTGMRSTLTSGELTNSDWVNKVSYSHTQMYRDSKNLTTNADDVQIP